MFAGIYSVWEGPGGVKVHQFASLTCEPNDLVRPIHHRMGAILAKQHWSDWLNGDDVPIAPVDPRSLVLEKAEGMDQARSIPGSRT